MYLQTHGDRLRARTIRTSHKRIEQPLPVAEVVVHVQAPIMWLDGAPQPRHELH